MTSSGVWLLALVPCLLTSLVCARPSSVELDRSDNHAEQESEHQLTHESDVPFRSRRQTEGEMPACCFLCKKYSCRVTCTDMCKKYFSS